MIRAKKFFNLSKRNSSKGLIDLSLYKPGNVVHGYKVQRVVKIPDFSMTAVELKHAVTGSEHLHLARDDKNNVFNVLLRTTPMSSNGVAHILEHVALCGSQKYPVRDPFFKMLNRSMSSFMNAMTGSDFTMYPFSTQHSQIINSQRTSMDFKNLLSVYVDSVFFPKIRKLDFLQEGWRLEHEDIDEKTSPIIFKGVVFNEMKGMMSDPGYLYGTAIQNFLLPDHTYAICSGGRPANIPELNWQDLVDFHSTHYHPSNAKFMTYGDLPLENHLKQINEEVMQKFEKIIPDTDVPLQKLWTKPKYAFIKCPVDAMAPQADKQTTFSANYLLPEVSDVFETSVASIVCTLLTDGPVSPFYKSLIESGLGSDYSPNTGYHNQTKQAIFSVGLQGISQDDADKVETLINQTLDDVIQSGFSSEHVESVLHRIELSTKHQSSHFGLGLTFNVLPTWQHGADPVESLQVDQLMKKLRDELARDPDFLKKKCEEYFKRNQHKLWLKMSPDDCYKEKADKEEAKNLQIRLNQLSNNEKEEIFSQGIQLRDNQNMDEDLSSLPSLSVQDIPEQQEEHAVTSGLWVLMDNPHVVVTSSQPTNGVTYFNDVIPVDEMREDLKPFLPLFCDVLTQVGTNLTDYVTFAQREDICTGGLVASIATSCVRDPMTMESYVRLRSHCLDRNTDAMFDLWNEIFHEVNFNDQNRLQTLIRQSAQSLANGVSISGHVLAMRSAAQYLTPSAMYDETFTGLTQVKMMQKLAEAEDLSDVEQKLRQIATFVLRKRAMTHAPNWNGRSMIHAVPDVMTSATQLLDKFVQGKPDRAADSAIMNDKYKMKEMIYADADQESHCRPVRWTSFQDHVPGCRQLFHPLPLQVNFASMCLPTSSTYISSSSASLKVLAKLLTTRFLHREIREKGGAYGGGASHGSDGVFRFFSYRDPNHLETILTFKKSLEWASSGSFSQQDVDEAILAVFRAVDAPVSPSNRGLDFFLHGLTNELKQLHRNQLLSVSIDDLVEAARRLKDTKTPGVALMGPQNEEIEKSDDWFVVSSS